MNKTGIAALAAVGGLVIGALVGPHVPGLAATDTRPAVSDSALADRLAIEDLVTRYYENFGEAGAAEAFTTYYTVDAVFVVNGIVSTGREEIEALYAGMADTGESPSTQGTFHMLISNPVIDVTGDTATAKFMWTGVMNSTVDARPTLWEQGREYDLLVRQDGQWKIKKRVVIADSGLPESMKATYRPRRDYDITAE
jgi:uncharacterized protein (TIGR02246 family)